MIIVLSTVEDQRQEQAVYATGIRLRAMELQGPSQAKLIDRGTEHAEQGTITSMPIIMLIVDLG